MGRARDLVFRDHAPLYIAYVMHIWAPLSQLLGGAAVDPQLIAMTADCSSTCSWDNCCPGKNHRY